MGQPSIDVVLAGTKTFAVALLAPVTVRLGNRPRVASDAAQVAALCTGPSALAVIEFTEGALPTIQALIRNGQGVRVVAGLSPAHAAAEGALRALGVEVGLWDGKVDGVIGAVERVVAAMGAPAAVSPAPRPSVPAAAPPSRPVPVVRPGAPAAPASSAARPAAPRGAPPAKPAARAAAVPSPPLAARPSTGAAQAVMAPPVAPRASAVPSPSLAARPSTLAAQAVVAPPVAPRASAVPSPSLAARPSTGAAQAVMAPPVAPRASAQAAAVKTAAPRPPPAPARQGPPVVAKAPAKAVSRPGPAPTAALEPAARPAPAFFDDLDEAPVEVVEEPALPAPEFQAPAMYVPPPPVPRFDWPAGIASAAEAEAALVKVLGGGPPSRPLEELAERTLESLSDLERGVLSGEPPPLGEAPIRKAAVLRLRVADALSSAPATGSPVDTTALSTVLGEIDALLAEVATLLSGAPEALGPALEAIRNALVSEAIDFSEAAQRVAATQPAASEAPKALVPSRAPQARVLSVEKETEADRSQRRRSVVVVVLLLVAGLAAAGFHGYRYYKRSQLVAVPSTLDVPTGLRMPATPTRGPVILHPGKDPVDRAALQRFREAQEAAGKDVYEMKNGTILVVPHGVPPPEGVKQ
ncbi:MAG TPA: hypothetical protein VFG59_07000 [Anaeromyxobacter sp.]|nr:hypothetical protein [Anaeromyxobacter sp.]